MTLLQLGVQNYRLGGRSFASTVRIVPRGQKAASITHQIRSDSQDGLNISETRAKLVCMCAMAPSLFTSLRTPATLVCDIAPPVRHTTEPLYAATEMAKVIV